MELYLLKEKVTKIKKKIFKHSSGEWDGVYKSKTRGSGLQFKEHNVYNYGDEIRFIDWKVYARTNTPYIKTFEEERNVNLEYVIDLNSNLFIGYNNVFKIDALMETFSLMCLVSKKFNDTISLTLIFDKVYVFKPMNGEKLIIKLLTHFEKIGLLDQKGKWLVDKQTNHDWDITVVNKNIIRALSKQRPVFYFLSDLSDYNYISQFLKYPNFHAFMILSPIESGNSTPFTVKASDGISNFSYRLNSIVTTNNINNKIKLLKIEEDYIESFMKQVL